MIRQDKMDEISVAMEAAVKGTGIEAIYCNEVMSDRSQFHIVTGHMEIGCNFHMDITHPLEDVRCRVTDALRSRCNEILNALDDLD